MAASDNFQTLDEILSNIRQVHADELKAVNDALLAKNIECELMKKEMDRLTAENVRYLRVTTKLITQFGVVEKVFSEAKAMALALEAEARVTENPPPRSLSEPQENVS